MAFDADCPASSIVEKKTGFDVILSGTGAGLELVSRERLSSDTFSRVVVV